MLDPITSLLDTLRRPQFGVRLLQMALGGNVQEVEASNTSIQIRYLKTSKQEPRYWAHHFQASDGDIDIIFTSFRSMDLGMPSQLIAVQRFLQYFICLTNNDALAENHVCNAVNWLLQIFDRSLFLHIFNRRTIMSKLFMRKILPASINTRNEELVRDILERGFESKHCRSHGLSWSLRALHEDCIRIAVHNQDHRMLRLLCEAGFRPHFNSDQRLPLSSQKYLPWRTKDLEVLQILLSFKADPDCMLTDASPGFPLVDAAGSGNLRAVEMLINAGSNVNIYVGSYLGTPLQAAVYWEQLEVARFLIEKGADVNAPYGDQYRFNEFLWTIIDYFQEETREHYNCSIKTPIQIACDFNNVPLFELLLARGAIVDISPLSQMRPDDMGLIENIIKRTHSSGSSFDDFDDKSHDKTIQFHTALQYTVRNGNIGLMHQLLTQGAHPDLRAIPDWGDTPLQMAVRLSYREIVFMLIESGADVNAPPGRTNGRTALQAAAEVGNYEMVQFFLDKNANANAPAGLQGGLTALQAAIKNDHCQVVELLLRSNAKIDVSLSANDGLSANEAIISQNNLSQLDFLLLHESKDGMKIPDICAAAKSGRVDLARHFLKNGSNVDSFYYDNRYRGHREIWGYLSPLTWSIIKQDLDMMDLLLKSGATVKPNFDDKTSRENDALCLALTQECCSEIILLLCQKYATLGPLYIRKETMAMATIYTYNKRISTMILKLIQGIMSGTPELLYSDYIFHAWTRLSYHITESCKNEIEGDHLKPITDYLLGVGADINMIVSRGATMLQMAVKNRKMKLAGYLCEIGAEIDLPACYTVGTPLQEAIKNGESEFVQILLERGVNLNAPPAFIEGLTALQAASRAGYIKIAIELLRRGAQINAGATRLWGVPAINIAAKHGRLDMLWLLLVQYDDCEDIEHVCQEAAIHAERAGHVGIAKWLQGDVFTRYDHEAPDTKSN